MDITFLNKFNNYFNRKIIKFDNYSDYTSGYSYQIFTNIDFDPADGITTTQIVNWDPVFTPDYMLVSTTGNNHTMILSRWFVIEWNRTKGGQYKATLKRDVIADYRNDIIAAPCYIEKATIRDASNPFIYNSEGIKFNQIKKEEILLKDKSECPWIVGYLSKNHGEITANIASHTPVGVVELSVQDIGDWEYAAYTSTPYLTRMSNVRFITTIEASLNSKYRMVVNENGNVNLEGWSKTNACFCKPNIDFNTAVNSLGTSYTTIGMNYFTGALNNIAGIHTDATEFLSYNGKVVKTTSNKYYRVSIFAASEDVAEVEGHVRANENTLGAYMKLAVTQASVSGTGSFKDIDLYPTANNMLFYRYKPHGYFIAFQELEDFAATATIPTTSAKCSDAVYDMFCMPYGDITLLEGTDEIELLASTQLEIALALATAGGSGGSAAKVYDLQILPYCPVPEVVFDWSSGKFIQGQGTEDIDYSYVKDSDDETYGVIFYPTKSSFSLIINKILKGNIYNALDKKIMSETEMLRLVSPNYQGQFEFNQAKNNGVNYFDVDCTYRPYSPYIHISPDFNGLYGADFDDCRGLICNGDFSVGLISDAFVNYQLQNKNYEAIFNRQIEHMETEGKIARQEALWQTFAGTLSGGVSGAFAGGMTFGGYGALGGAVLGTGLSAIGGAMDMRNLEARLQEAKSYTTDMYNMNLQNIQALSYSITKNSPFTKNNKFFPFIEFYDCTTQEKEALRNKLTYDGMTIGAIGTIEDYLGPELSYVKGQIIRLDTISEDAHLVNEIYNEIYKGVYI